MLAAMFMAASAPAFRAAAAPAERPSGPNARNTTRIGSAHEFSFSGALGYGSADLARFASGSVDWNAPASNLRVRGVLNADQIFSGIAGSLAAEGNWLFELADGFYGYPLASLKFGYHNLPNWPSKISVAPGVGGGLEYQFNSWIGVFGQAHYEYAFGGINSRLITRGGLVVAFGKGKRAQAALSSKEQARVAAEEAARVARERAEAEHKAIREAEDAKFAARFAGMEDISSNAKGSRYLVAFAKGSSAIADNARLMIQSIIMLMKDNTALELVISPGPATPTTSDGRLSSPDCSTPSVPLPGGRIEPASAAQPTSAEAANATALLPARRAEALRAFFLQAGIDPARVSISGSSVATDFVALEIK